MANYSLKYGIDIVFCIDCTNSMAAYLDNIKKSILSFINDLHENMVILNRDIGEIRVKLIAFRDYLANKDKAMLLTDFFTLPNEYKEFERCLYCLKPEGAGDECEDGLEALAYAIRSKWSNEWMKRRQVIVVWSDSGTHPLGHGKASEFYPKGMAQDLKELTMWWGDHYKHPGCMDDRAKRLVLFTPDVSDWSVISQNWSNVIHFPSNAGFGMTEIEYKEILFSIMN